MGELLAWVVLIVRRIAGLTGDDHQPAGIGENPAVIHALKSGRRPLAFVAHDRPAVRTGVDERVIAILLVAREPHRAPGALRSEERRDGKEGVSKCRSRGSPNHSTQNTKEFA